MSASQEYFEEKEKIDFLLYQGYQITRVSENLDGAAVEFERAGTTNQEREVLLIQTADARKYFSTIMFHQQKNLTPAE
ncbi:hypothetical protein P4361_23045 [Fictibacillus sp. B-59209]|uniref:hypothetical protein n=1 Tax=Fictibacillus sp. B-59209 TaxID=3024873 RepID=UPI002E1CB2F6|nr:hypothetical protein [Fictibacillus sp. B-59209]